MKDRTTVGMIMVDSKGALKSGTYPFYYKDVEEHEDFPDVAKSSITKKEFERFKTKQREEKLANKIIAYVNQIHKRSKL